MLILMLMMKQHSKNSWKPQQIKPIFSGKRASGGPGMQAIFLDFDRKCCGTGVFLPQRAGTNFQPGKKPGNFLFGSRESRSIDRSIHLSLFSQTVSSTKRNKYKKHVLVDVA